MTSHSASKSINEMLGSAPLSRLQNELRKSQVIEAFSEFVSPSSFTTWHLALWRFATIRPLKFCRRETIRDVVDFLNAHPEQTIEAAASLRRELTHAVFSLLRPGSSWQKEDSLSLDDPMKIAEFDGIWHPEYQRYCEHVFNHLIQVPLFVLGTLCGKNYTKPPLRNRISILESNGLETLTRGCDPMIRNAISHGRVSFDLFEVAYADGTEGKSLTAREFGVLFDDLVDTCHSLLIGLLLAICGNRSLTEEAGIGSLPLGLRFIFVDGFISHRGLQLDHMVEHGVSEDKRQLSVFCRVHTKSRTAHLFEGFRVGWQACRFGGQGYHRFYIGIDCGKPVAASLSLDGERLNEAIVADESIEACGPQILQQNLLWYDGSQLDHKLYIWRNLFAIQWPIFRGQLIRDWRERGLMWSPQYTILTTENTSPSQFTRLETHVVLRENSVTTGGFLIQIVRHILNRLRKRRMRRKDIEGEIGHPQNPKIIIVKLYSADRRLRRLKSSGWNNEDLILIAEWAASKKLAYHYYTKQADAIMGQVRIKYNPMLLRADASPSPTKGMSRAATEPTGVDLQEEPIHVRDGRVQGSRSE